MYHVQFESGELVVSGCNTVKIHLKELPRQVDVHFKKLDPAPCEHHHHHHHHRHDKLSWEVHHHHHNHHHSGYKLIISWDVNSVREIIWGVNF